MQTSGTESHLDVSEATFERDVIDESHRRPVVVDFWAPWCGPCRTLGPILERLASESGGGFLLAKVNVDENPRLAMLFRVQGIPAVKAVKNGALVDEFTGVLPEHQVRAWLERFVPGPAEEAVAEGERLEAAGKTQEARASFERALELKGRHGRALLGLARLEAAAGETEAAARHLDQILPADAGPLTQEIAALRLQLGGGGDLRTARERAAKNPDDLEAQVALGRALAAAGQHEPALQTFLGVVKKSPRVGPGEDARKAMIEVFDVVGARSDLADHYRSLLAQELYK